jgi:hypothetical protein
VFRVRALVFLVLAVVATTSCRAAVDVAIGVAEGGSGEVAVTASFDDEAKAQLGGDLAGALHAHDLETSGWVVGTPRHAGNTWRVTATKPFASAAGLQTVLEEVGGRNGVFRDWKLTNTASTFGRQTWTIKGRVVLTGSLDQFGDAALTQALGGLPLGRTPDQLRQELGANGSIPFTVKVALPAAVDSADDTNGSARDFPADIVSWHYAVPGRAVDEQLTATASSGGTAPYVLFGGAALAVIVAVSLMIVFRVRARSRAEDGP